MNKEHQVSLARINACIEGLEEELKCLEGIKVKFATDLRHDLNLSISHFAQILGVSSSYICMLEKGKQPWSAKLWGKLMKFVQNDVAEEGTPS